MGQQGEGASLPGNGSLSHGPNGTQPSGMDTAKENGSGSITPQASGDKGQQDAGGAGGGQSPAAPKANSYSTRWGLQMGALLFKNGAGAAGGQGGSSERLLNCTNIYYVELSLPATHTTRSTHIHAHNTHTPTHMRAHTHARAQACWRCATGARLRCA